MIIEHIYKDLLNDYINISMFFNRRFVVESRGLCNGLHDVGNWFIEEVEKNHKDCINQLMCCNNGDTISFVIERENFIVNPEFKVHHLCVECHLSKDVEVKFDSGYEPKTDFDRKEFNVHGEKYNDIDIALSVSGGTYGELIKWLTVSFEHEMLHAYVDCLMSNEKLMSVVGREHNYHRKSFVSIGESKIKSLTRNFLYKTTTFERGALIQQTSRELSSMGVPMENNSEIYDALRKTTAYKEIYELKTYVENVDYVFKNQDEMKNECVQYVNVFNMLSEKKVNDITTLRNKVSIIFAKYQDKLYRSLAKVAVDVRGWRKSKDLYTREERKQNYIFK